MNRFTCIATPLQGLLVVERQRRTDTRGFLARMFCAEEFSTFGWKSPVAQINHTCTLHRGTVRGLHFQHPPHCEMKLVSCLRGAIWDVAVDIRVGSPTYLNWHAVNLSTDNQRAFLIPEGFAHGFQTCTDNVELLYLHSAAWVAQAEGGMHPLDPQLCIDWPIPVTEISARDMNHPFINQGFQGIPQ